MQLYKLNHNLPLASLRVVEVCCISSTEFMKYSSSMFVLWHPIGDETEEDVIGDFYKDDAFLSAACVYICGLDGALLHFNFGVSAAL